MSLFLFNLNFIGGDAAYIHIDMKSDDLIKQGLFFRITFYFQFLNTIFNHYIINIRRIEIKSNNLSHYQ